MDGSIEIFIVRSGDELTSEELMRRLEESPGWDDSIRLEVRTPEQRPRGVDPTFLSAACTAAGAVLGTLIASLLNVAQSLGKQKIAIQLADGTRIEVEGPNALKTVEKLLPLIESKAIITI